MVDIYGRSARGKAQQQGDLSKYATLGQLINDLRFIKYHKCGSK